MYSVFAAFETGDERSGAFGWGYLDQILLGYPIIVYSVANYRPHFSHLWANVIVISRTEFNVS